MNDESKNEELNIENNKKRNKTANKLCLISLILTLSCIFMLYASLNFTAYSELSQAVLMFLFFLGPFLNFIAFMIMIVVTSEYPENKFGKILMWLHIILFIAFIIFVIYFICFFINSCRDCCNTLGNLG